MKPLQLNFKPSIILSVLLTLMSLGTFCIVMLLGLSWQIKLPLGFVIVTSAIYTVLFHGLLMLPWSCVVLSLDINNQLRLTRKDGQQLEVTALANSVVLPYLTVLNYQHKSDSQAQASLRQRLFALYFITHSLIILPDRLDAEKYRQLRVWLRWGYLR